MSTPRKAVLEIVQSTTGYFQKHGIESPRLNAELLIAHVLKVKRLDLYLDFERTPYEDELVPLREMMRKRSTGTPLQHLLGSVEFFGRVFQCDVRALVPRPETEHLVELLLPSIRETTSTPIRVADIGTGTGIIALSVAAEIPETEVWAIDISPAALALAQENARQLEEAEATPEKPSTLSERVHFLSSNLLETCEAPFDWIIANLPYIPSGEIPQLSREVQFDPPGALDGGMDGLDLVRRLIEQAPGKLNPNGGIALEIGHDQAERVAVLLAAGNFRDIRIEKDYQGISRFLIARHG